MSKIMVMNDTYREITSEADPDDKWSVESYSIDNNIRGILKSDKYFDLDVPFEVNKNEIYFLVVGYYSTGSSFHRGSGEVEYVDLYKSKDLAENCQKVLEEHDKKNTEFTCKLIRENGIEYQFYVPWKDCFEELEYIDVIPVEVISDKNIEDL